MTPEPAVVLRCITCDREFARRTAEHRYRIRKGMMRPFCSMKCFGRSRRVERSDGERRERKRAYDQKRRVAMSDEIRQKKREYHLRTYNPDRARAARKKRARWHAEYCRAYYSDPERKAAKVAYDQSRRASVYGPFADAYLLLLELQREIISRSPDRYVRLRERGYYQRSAHQRRRDEGFIR